jgi:hypothetical protein
MEYTPFNGTYNMTNKQHTPCKPNYLTLPILATANPLKQITNKTSHPSYELSSHYSSQQEIPKE